MLLRDWAYYAAVEIDGDPGTLTLDGIRAILAKHCPFRSGVVYMPVPRCETCRYWERFHSPADQHGECLRIIPGELDVMAYLEIDYQAAGYSGNLTTLADFGCVQWEAK